MSAVIREARREDVDGIVTMLLEFLATTEMPLKPTRDYALQFVHKVMDGGVVYVAEQDGELLGTIGGRIDFHVFDPEVLVLAELWWWVSPQHRRSTAGLLLLEAFRERGLQDVDVISMSTLDSTPAPIGEYLERKGFKRREQQYLLDVAAVLSAQHAEAVAAHTADLTMKIHSAGPVHFEVPGFQPPYPPGRIEASPVQQLAPTNGQLAGNVILGDGSSTDNVPIPSDRVSDVSRVAISDVILESEADVQ